MFSYTAKLYIDKKTIEERSGNNLEELYIWMMAKAHNQTSHYRGSIINNSTQKIIRNFQTCSLE
ncbi:hypothetical protein [Legionella cardiaca]|uniref:Uncharacterized protein n=1 Tax=Legionella cardiaca TaxID=1071983 RepID=A0ABY8AVF8_9GAMM|nr:hypothetical protein [Legionella cardiaca]WED43726.1 hypothetical protein PXX05_02815 [Legionella cardiaca]